jgi:DNA-binding CsgD family transcriptional regulator/tetratricopeptide (TPR) repeat protein
MVGRSQELALLHRALTAAGDGTGGFVLVEGDAGMGKTRLVETFTEAAAGQGARVLRGCCLPLAEDLPYAPVLEILHHLGAVRTPSRPEERHRFFRHVADALTAEDAPTVAVVEDLHWADTSTRDLLVYLARALHDAAVLLVGTVRSDEPAPAGPLAAMLSELARSGRAVRLGLRPLGRNEVTEQLAGILGADPPATLARRLFERADGNPFFVEELLAADPRGQAVPPTVSEIVLARLCALSPSAQRVLRAAAVIGRTMDHVLLAAVCGLPDRRLETALREATTQQLLVTTDGGYAFRHALIAEAVYSGLLPGERARLHGRVAGTLADRAARARDVPVLEAEVAHHWDASGRTREALAASMRAGTAAETLAAPAAAHAQYERTLRLWPRVPDAVALAGLDRPALLARAAQVASLAGRYERAGDLVAEALEEVDSAADPLRAAALLERLGRHRWLAGCLPAAWAAYEEAGRLVGDRSPSADGAQVLAALAQSLMLRSRRTDAIRCARKAIDVARAVDGACAEGHASNTLGTCLCALGRPEEGLPLLRRAVRVALDLDDPAEIERGYNNLAESLTAVGHHTEALAIIEEAITHMRRCGIAPAYEPEFHGYAARAHTRLGRWDEADDATRAALAGLAEAPSSALIAFVYPHALLLETRRGRLTEAAELLDALATAVQDIGGAPFTVELTRQSAELALTRKRFGQATTAVKDGLRQPVDALHCQGLGLALCALGARAAADAHADAIRGGRRADRRAAFAEADALADRAQSIIAEITTAGGAPGPDQVGYLLLTCAERSRLGSEPDPEGWAALAADRAAATDPFLTAYSRFRQAEAVLLSRGARSKAAPLLTGAYRTAQRLGAAPLAADIEELARRAGINLTEPAPAPATQRADTAGFDLTPREHEVIALLAQGLTNGQIAQTLFISTKTASVHVSAILRKLGVTTRIQAAAIAQQTARPPADPASSRNPGTPEPTSADR